MPKSSKSGKAGMKRQNEDLLAQVLAENKRLKQENQCFEIRQSMQKLHEALKPRFVRLDELVNNNGLKHVALHIFKKLSPKDLGNCRLVSKGWQECIDNDKYWWQEVQFAHCKRVITTYQCVVPRWRRKETLNEYCPELMDVIKYVFQEEPIENMKLFSEFMMNYEDHVTEGMEEDCEEEIHGPLHYAIEQEDFPILKMFVRSPMKNLNIWDWNEYYDQDPLHVSPLGHAICRGQVKVIEFFMTEGREKVDFNYIYGDVSLFHEACRSNNAEIVKLFLDHATELNIDLNPKDDSWHVDGMTPFMLTKTKEVAELLLGDERIDVNATDNGNGTILDNICGSDETYYPEDTHDFTEEQIVETLDFLLHSPRIDYPTEGQTPLHTACYHGHEARVETVLKFVKEKGFDINQKNEYGLTPLHCIFMSDFKKPTTVKEFSPTMDVMLKCAKDFGIDLEATDNKGKTPLHTLYSTNHKENHENVRAFLELVKKEYKIEFNHKATNEDGKTPPELSSDYKRFTYIHKT